MKLTNKSKGSLIFVVNGQAIDLQPGETTKEIGAKDAEALHLHPIVSAWMKEGRLVSNDTGAIGGAAAAAAAAGAPRKGKAVKVTEVMPPDAPEGVQLDIEG